MTKIKQILFMVFALLLFSFYVYLRFLPKNEIPFNYNVWIISTCIGFILINITSLWFIKLFLFFYSLLFYDKLIESKPSSKLTKLITFFYKPFKTFYKEFLSLPYFPEILMNFAVLNYTFAPYIRLPYLLFNVIPRIVIVIALYIDISHTSIYYFYKVLPLLLILIIYNFLLKCAYDLLLQRLDVATTTYSFFWLFEEPYITLCQAVAHYQEIMFEYRPDVPLEERSTEGLNTWFTLYTVTVYLATFFKLPRADFLLSSINSILFFLLAMEWWYILFYVLLNK